MSSSHPWFHHSSILEQNLMSYPNLHHLIGDLEGIDTIIGDYQRIGNYFECIVYAMSKLDSAVSAVSILDDECAQSINYIADVSESSLYYSLAKFAEDSSVGHNALSVMFCNASLFEA